MAAKLQDAGMEMDMEMSMGMSMEMSMDKGMNTEGNTERNTEGNADRNTEGNTERNMERNTDRNMEGNAERNMEGNAERNMEGNAERNTEGNAERNMEGNAERNTERNKGNGKRVLGILAHVDAGKTTLAESMLYLGGRIRTLGRVDHGDAFLDNDSLEKSRGITIFSKQARFTWRDTELVLLDTPGHVDFAAEMERTLQVLDAAILVINGADGVQGHTRTLWRLLKQYGIPVMLFVNKMDQVGANGPALLEEIRTKLDGNCVAFSDWNISEEQLAQGGPMPERDREEWMEEVAFCDEELMNRYLDEGDIDDGQIAEAFVERKLFPCYFGAALKLCGVENLLDGMITYCPRPYYPETFGACVYKISRDASGNRLTHLKVSGGSLRVRMLVGNEGSAAGEEDVWQEKISQIRLYNGAGYEAVDEVQAGDVCVVTGLSKTRAGQGLGMEPYSPGPVLEPVLSYRVELPEGVDERTALAGLLQLEEEEPLLHVLWQEESREIHVLVMGQVQIEVLQKLMAERFGLEVAFGTGSIVYKETIASCSIGIGHFEPLRHYAEVELLLEPGERGSGLEIASLCSEDILDRNWQRLIMTHLEERAHVGVLTGSQVTDLRVLLVAGRAHAKHTEGGDFRQATYRAVRHGLMGAESVLLEPVFAFELELPTEYLGAPFPMCRGCVAALKRR